MLAGICPVITTALVKHWNKLAIGNPLVRCKVSKMCYRSIWNKITMGAFKSWSYALGIIWSVPHTAILFMMRKQKQWTALDWGKERRQAADPVWVFVCFFSIVVSSGGCWLLLWPWKLVLEGFTRSLWLVWPLHLHVAPGQRKNWHLKTFFHSSSSKYCGCSVIGSLSDCRPRGL